MRSYSVAVLLIAVLFTIVFFKKDDLIEARGSRGGGSRSSGSSYRSSSSRYSRSSSSSYSDRRRTGVYDSRRRTDYSRRRSSWDSSSDYDYSRRRSYYNSDYRSTGSSGGGGLSTGAILGIVIGVGGLCLIVYCCKHCNETGGTGTFYTAPAYDDVGPSTNIGPAESAPAGYTPVLPSDPTGSVGYSTHKSPAFFSMATGPSSTPSQAPPPLPSQYPTSQHSPASYPANPDSGIQDPPCGTYEQPGMQAPPLPLPPQISEELDNNDNGMSMGGYPPPVPPALPTYPSPSIVPPHSIIPPPPTVAPPIETVDDPSMHVSAPADAPPPSYNDLFKS